MKKKALTTVALGAATLAAGMAGNVHADSVKVTKQQIGDETKITTTTTKDVNQQKIAQDKQNISSQQTVVSSAKSSLDKAKANASSAEKNVKKVQQTVDNAKKNLYNRTVNKNDISNIRSKVANDQSQVNTDKQNISATQSSIKSDQDNISKDQQAMNNADQAKKQAQDRLNNDQSKLSNAQNTLNNDQSKLNNVKSQLADNDIPAAVNVDSQYQDTFWKRLLNQDSSAAGLSVNDLINETNAATDAYNEAYNELKPSRADDYQVDPSNLTNDQKMELSKFAAQIINEYKDEAAKYLDEAGITDEATRKRLMEHVNASNICVDLGQDLANYMAQHNKGYMGNDDQDVCDYFNNDMKNYNDNNYGYNHTTSSPLSDFNSSTTPGFFNHSYYTMNDLKMQVYDTILTDIFRDAQNNFSHSTLLLYSNYIGIASTNFSDASKDYLTITEGNDAGTRVTNDDPYMQVQTTPSISALQNQESQLQDQVNKDQQIVNDLQNQVNADKQALQTGSPEQQLQNDQKKLADDQATLQKQQQKLAQDEAQLKADQNKLNSITPEDIANAQKALDQAQTNYNNAVKALNEAQSKANVSNDELAKAQQNYINALNKLNELKQILENDEKQITTTSVQWIKNQHPATTSSMGNKVVLHSSSKANASSVVSSEKEANTVHADTVNAVKLAQADAIHFTSEASVSSKKAAKKNALPQMGDENSNKTVWGEISLAMAGVLATLGLVGKKRHE
ncbi:SEC10/PgrA surface exclusion domain-containing protein [Ligilactobacillus aviarius]|uniref:SEC10/PgrA surface exclusion domain-containing protein n=1 Tax=Ligilactobacillus aviarius TaxID=1606 RepID=UPI0024BB5529|nr:SEC10/PgrA surface exclusion domain-containing protein [Ligilactobacillus aviarius]